MAISLSNRLAAVAKMIKPGESVADIGADHARLALYLAENNIASQVIIGELRDGPYQRAQVAVQGHQANYPISVRQGNGLQILSAGEVDTIVIAGLGGDTIVGILAHDWNKARSFGRFIFQPMSKAEVLRQNLAEQGWTIDDEWLAREERRIYLVIASHPGGCPVVLSDLELEIGPQILKLKDKTSRAYIQSFRQKYRRIYNNLSRSPHKENVELVQIYREKIKSLEEILDDGQG